MTGYDYWLLEQFKESLVDFARHAATTEAKSYRGFHVGCAVLARNPTTQRHKIFWGGNEKLEKNGRKVCAERRAVLRAIGEGYTYIVALAVTGPNQRDDVSKVMARTLHPCHECRMFLDQLKGMAHDRLIITQQLPIGPREEWPFGVILEMHGTRT